MNLTIWRHIRIAMPANWELMRFAREADAGRCLFADESSFRLELKWREFATCPDIGAMMERRLASYRSKGVDDANRHHFGAWQGISGMHDDRLTNRYAMWMAAESCLVEIIFLWPGLPDVELEEQILASIDREPAVNGLRRWRAYGLDLRVPDRLQFEACKLAPDHAVFSFADPANEVTRMTFERQVLDLVSDTAIGLKPRKVQTLADWLKARAPAKSRLHPGREAMVLGHAIATAVATVSDYPWWLPFGKVTTWSGSAWTCPHDGRRYLTSSSHPGRPTAADAHHAPDRLRCCPAVLAASDLRDAPSLADLPTPRSTPSSRS